MVSAAKRNNKGSSKDFFGFKLDTNFQIQIALKQLFLMKRQIKNSTRLQASVGTARKVNFMRSVDSEQNILPSLVVLSRLELIPNGLARKLIWTSPSTGTLFCRTSLIGAIPLNLTDYWLRV